MGYIAICLAMWNSAFLSDNYALLDFIDTICTFVMICHAIRYYNTYLNTAKNCLWGIIAIVFINRIDIDFQLKNEVYFNLYLLICSLVVIFSVKDNLNENIK
jgi:hypothetical protein